MILFYHICKSRFKRCYNT